MIVMDGGHVCKAMPLVIFSSLLSKQSLWWFLKSASFGGGFLSINSIIIHSPCIKDFVSFN